MELTEGMETRRDCSLWFFSWVFLDFGVGFKREKERKRERERTRKEGERRDKERMKKLRG